MNFVFAGDRDIAVYVLDYILSTGQRPLALFLSGKNRATHSNILREKCSFLDGDVIFEGIDFRSEKCINKLLSLDIDYIIGVHFPYIISKDILDIPKYGFINLHPAYLPYNRGWHTPSWAILEKTKIGGTLHFMDESVDSGDIILQKEIEILPNDTANTLYKRIKDCEIEVFKEAWPLLLDNSYNRLSQRCLCGTEHFKKDLFSDKIQKIDLEKEYKAEYLIDKIRALTTSSLEESAYFFKDGKKYRLQIQIYEEE